MKTLSNKELFYTKLVRLISNKNKNEKIYVKIAQGIWAIYYDAVEQRGKQFCHICGCYNCKCEELSRSLNLVHDRDLLKVMEDVEKLDRGITIDTSTLINPKFFTNEVLSNLGRC